MQKKIKPKFLNKTTMDKKTCRDFMAMAWPKNAGVLRIVLLVVAALAVGYAILQLAMGGMKMFTYAGGIFLMGCVAFFLGKWGYVLRMGQYIQKQKKLWRGDTLSKKVAFYEDRFEQTSHLGKLRFSYEKVDKLLQNRRSLLLYMGQDALLISKNGFETGNADEFCRFIRDKIENK